MVLAKTRGGHARLRASRLGNLLGPTLEEEEEEGEEGEGEGVSTLDPTCCLFLRLQDVDWAGFNRLHGAARLHFSLFERKRATCKTLTDPRAHFSSRDEAR